MNILRNKIKALVAEFYYFVNNAAKLAKTKTELLSFDKLVGPEVEADSTAKLQLVVPESTFVAINSEINKLAKDINPTSYGNGTAKFLKRVRAVFKRYGVDETEYWTDVAIRRFTAPKFVPIPLSVIS